MIPGRGSNIKDQIGTRTNQIQMVVIDDSIYSEDLQEITTFQKIDSTKRRKIDDTPQSDEVEDDDL